MTAGFSIFFWVLAMGFLFLSLAGSSNRVAEFQGAQVCLPLAAALASALLGWGVARRTWRFALWAALALVGHAAALQLIQAGPMARYQHYLTPGRSWSVLEVVAMGVVALQGLLVPVGLRNYLGALRAWSARHLPGWRLVAVLAVVSLTSATVQADPQFFVVDLVFASVLQLVAIGNVILVAATCPLPLLQCIRRGVDTVLGPAESGETPRQGRIDRFVLLAAGWAILLSALLSWFVYDRHPHITDEVAYVLHARMLAKGALMLPGPPVPEAFTVYLTSFQGGQWFVATPPGWPLVLAIGTAVGAGWLMNPLLTGLNVLLCYLLVWHLYGPRTARIVTLLLAVSPWHIFMGMNLMTHVVTLTCALGGALLLVRARASGALLPAAFAGALVGYASVTRPVDGVVIGGLLGLWAIGLGGSRLKLAGLVAFAAGAIAIGALVLPYNAALTGNAAVLPLNAYLDQNFGAGRNAYGFGPNRGFGWPLDPNPGHSVIDGIINTSLNSFSLNTELLGWATGSLLLIAVALFSGVMRKPDRVMLAVIATVVAAYFPYYYSGGPDFGPRYWYLIIPACVALVARGFEVLERSAGAGEARTRVVTGVLALCLLTLVNYIPWRSLDKYHHLWGMRADIRELAPRAGFGRSLVLVRGEPLPDYASAAIYNPLDFDADAPIYAWDGSPLLRARVLAAYADRPVWIVNGPTLTGRGYEVASGPTPARELLGDPGTQP